MSLPAGAPIQQGDAIEVSWPPPEWLRIYGRYREHSAWYSGSPNELAAVYYAAANKPQGYWRTNYDRFWARSPAPQTRLMLHVPIASTLSSVCSDLLFAEPPVFVIDPEEDSDGAVQDRLDDILEANSFVRTCAELAETVAALGGGFLRILWNKDVDPDFPMIDSVDADAAIPEFQFGRLSAVTFWEELQRNDEEVWRYLERHSAGLIETGLYHGNDRQLGERLPIDALAGFQLNETAQTDVDSLTAVYIPNVRPNRVFRRDKYGRRLGRSDFDGLEPELDALDEAATSLMRDLRLARARLIVPEEFLESRGKGKGAKFDIDQEVWEGAPIDAPGFGMDKLITPSQFAIRADDHLKVIRSKLESIISAAGYAHTTFGIDMPRAVPATATEIINSERQSFLTRSKKILYWQPALEQLLQTVLEVDAAHFEEHPTYRPRVDFADSIRDDPQQQASIVHVLRSAEAASTEIRVRMVHPKWSDSQVEAETAKILDELVKPAASTTELALTSTAAAPMAQTAPGGMPEDMSSMSAAGGAANGAVAPGVMAENLSGDE